MSEIVRLQLGVPDDLTVQLAQPPDVSPGHGRPDLSDGAPAPRGPEQRGIGANSLNVLAQSLEIRLEELHHGGRQGDVHRLAALHLDTAQSPVEVEMADTKR